MYMADQREIERWCKNPDKLLTVGTMVLCSIRQPWVGVGIQVQDVKQNGSASTCLWGWKRAGYIYLRDNRVEMYRKVRQYRAGKLELGDLIRVFLKVPGLGLAKAGFMCQLLVGEAGCLDTHNVERFGLTPGDWLIRSYVSPSKQAREIDDKIELYLSLCHLCGGSRKLWDEWCEYLNDTNSSFESADDVSRRHVSYLKENY